MKRLVCLLLLIAGATWVWAEGNSQRRPSHDVIVKFPSTNGMTRVEFSHERHFGMFGVKTCKICHSQLGSDLPRRSLAAALALEPHGEKSRGRFCATCHHDKFTANQIEGAKPPINATLFTALGRKGDKSCDRCHAPAGHGSDYTGRHGDRAEHGAAKQCGVCHRGAGAVSSTDRAQVRAYREAQLALAKNSEDTVAFQKVLPNNFCAYCHADSGKGRKED